jgi:hypothetical protein
MDPKSVAKIHPQKLVLRPPSLSEKSELVGGEGFWLCAIGSSVTLATAGRFPFFRQALCHFYPD